MGGILLDNCFYTLADSAQMYKRFCKCFCSLSSHEYWCWLCDVFLTKYPRYVYVFIFTVMLICSCKSFSRMQVGIKWHFPGATLQHTSERLVKNNFQGFLFVRIISERHLLLSPLLWKSDKMLIVRKLGEALFWLLSAYCYLLLLGWLQFRNQKVVKLCFFSKA